MGRRVEFNGWGDRRGEKIHGVFHSWAVNDRNLAIAIIEVDGGQIMTPYASRITFLDPEEPRKD